MISPLSTNSSNPPPQTFSTAWSQSATNNYIAAWDITVRSSTGADLDGRVFTDLLPMNIGSFTLGINADVYVVTDHSYIYHVDTN